MNRPERRGSQARPMQARPVVRDERAEAAAARGDRGVAAAQGRDCGSLPGIARQMCYAAKYGVSV